MVIEENEIILPTNDDVFVQKILMGKKKVIAIVISIVGIAVITTTIITQAFIRQDIIFKAVDGSNNKVTTSLKESEKPKVLVDANSWDTSKVEIYTDKSENKAPIPKGYVASQVTGETEIKTGLVIYEGTTPVTGTEIGKPGTAAWNASCERNQWVWVPVPDVTRIYDTKNRKSKLYNITQTGRRTYNNSNYEPGIVTNYDNEQYFSKYNLPGMTRKKLLYELEIELNETIKSIEKYGGFYIGRYETGNVTNDGSANYIKPVIQRMNTNINYVTWYDAYMNLRTLGVNENVKANIIFGCLWDETLQWFRESGAKTDNEIYNSASWGNHLDSEGFTYYTNISGNTGTAGNNTCTRTPTGATERNKANNIYDMAGNVLEWTIERYGSSSRRLRGGYCNDSANGYSIGNRTYDNPHYSSYIYGVRSYFYIK